MAEPIDIEQKDKFQCQTLYQLLHIDSHAHSYVIAAAGDTLERHYTHEGNLDRASMIRHAKDLLLDSEKRELYDAKLRKSLKNTIGPYQLLEKIAEGGCGKVYKARHTILDEHVCIKVCKAVDPSERAIQQELLIKEAKAIYNLRHHALPAVRDVYILPDSSWALITGFIEGSNLEKAMTEKSNAGQKFTPETVCSIVDRVLDGLRYLHYHGVVHGDVKPANVIIQPEQRTAVLVDFGLASIRPTHQSRPDGHTPIFASPEALNGVPLVPESDLYSLGITMIYLFGGDAEQRRLPKDIPDELQHFVNDLIILDRNKRPHWAKVDLMNQLRDIRMKVFNRAHTNGDAIW